MTSQVAAPGEPFLTGAACKSLGRSFIPWFHCPKIVVGEGGVSVMSRDEVVAVHVGRMLGLTHRGISHSTGMLHGVLGVVKHRWTLVVIHSVCDSTLYLHRLL